MTPQEKFAATRSELSACLIERDAEIDLILTAMVAGEHALLVGPPGTAKSLLSDAVTGWIGGRKFSILMTKFTTPEEVFGPVSLAGLKQDVYRRIVTGKLPEAEVCFLDEVWKSSSAILNTLLTILNERIYYNDGTVIRCPLKLCVAASNEWPGDQEGGRELGALFDRFLLRKSVRPIATERGLDRLLWAPVEPKLSTTLTPGELTQANSEASALPWTDAAKAAFVDILRTAKQEGIVPGDRRCRKSVGVAQAFAWLNGAVAVEKDHLEILSHVLWDDPAEQPDKLAKIVGKIANPQAMRVNSLLMEAEQLVGKTDLHDLADCATTCKKLAEIRGKLIDMPGSKAKLAAEHVESEAKRIRLATVEAF